jgi:hypothetical protein
MEEFKDFRVPTLRLFEAMQYAEKSNDGEMRETSKPPCVRRSTDPTPSSPQSPGWQSPRLPYRPRNSSPSSRGHFRSRSSASALAPPMSRAQSLPGVNAAGHLHMSPTQRSSSPRGSPHRTRALRKPVDEVFPGMPKRPLVFNEPVATISESDETPQNQLRSSSPTVLMPNNTYPRTRRPSSPLRNLPLHSATAAGIMPTTPTSLIPSPSFPSTRFNEVTPGYYNYTGSSTSSSVPSTPNSLRSRSPSISSLETIPDSPDAEEAALEAERIAQLKADADAADGDEAAREAKRTGSLDNGARGRTLGLSQFGPRDKRKRWSVCGAERRGDLDLETIWED